jgi:hypothetical protein
MQIRMPDSHQANRLEHLRFKPWLAVLAASLLISLNWAEPTWAAQSAPETIKIGGFLTELGDLDATKKSFFASFWIWTISPGGEPEHPPLERIEFPNAIKIESPNAINEATPAGIWSQRKIVGNFRHNWDLHRFPFDRQLLRIEIEEAELDTTKAVYVADQENSSFDPDLKLSGWRIRSTTMTTGSKAYRTTFGDPRLQAGTSSNYAHAEMRILLERTDRTGFWKLTVGAFAAALMALASYGLRVDHASALSPRFGLLAGSTFAAVISLRSAATELGASGYTTLIDQVHAAVLAYVLLATTSGVVAWRRFQKHGNGLSIQNLELQMAAASTLGFGLTMALLIRGAMAAPLS